MQSRASQRFAWAAGALVAIVSLGACAGAASPTTSPPTSGSPTASAADCIVKSATPGQGDDSTAGLSALVPLITLGTFEGYGTPAWNTPDGRRPTQEQVQSGAPITIWRPLKTKTDQSLKGDAKTVTRAVARGGQIGCDVVDYGDPVLDEGQRYVFFFYDVSDSLGKLRGDLVLVTAWPVAADGTVTRPLEDPIAVSDLATAISGPAPSITPYPTPTPAESGPG
jgi:hypothetical protein